MTNNYKGYTISKLGRRGLYQVTDSTGKMIAVFPLLRHAKSIVDARIDRAA